MGQEINKIEFNTEDFQKFTHRLRHETELLRTTLEEGGFNDLRSVTGFELEGWLVDRNLFPAPVNQKILQHLTSPLVVPELSRFNLELNGTPQLLHNQVLSQLQTELEHTIAACQAAAHAHEATFIMIGTLPTLRNCDLCMANISPSKRFLALNDQVLKARRQAPIELDIQGEEHLHLIHHDVMLEAAATSFQIHLQTPPASFVSHFNASILASAAMVAAAANSPFLFGRNLWAETRIPLFEQSIAIQNNRRVSFGEGYLRQHDDCFQYNRDHHPVLLPVLFESLPGHFKHVRLHNGTVWRWNRPLLDFNAAGEPHFRIEHRILPAGPSVIDMIANAAFYLGMVHALAEYDDAWQTTLSFSHSEANFYRAARYGLEADVMWIDGKRHNIRALILDALLPLAAQGLDQLGIISEDRDYYLTVIQRRVESQQTGAAWQRQFINRHGQNFFCMTTEYLHRQQSGMPVHEWEI